MALGKKVGMINFFISKNFKITIIPRTGRYKNSKIQTSLERRQLFENTKNLQ